MDGTARSRSLLALATEHGVTLAFEASVGGGIPIIGPLVRDLAGNRITGVNAVINGTTNYMLTRMTQEGASYESALSEAQRSGYAEPDPSDDVDGRDAAYKLAILSTLAFRCTIREPDVYREGIRQLDAADFAYARELGYVIKLLAASRLHEGAVQARVHPAFLHEQHPLAKVDGVYNAVELEGDLVGWAMFQGPGAGASPTTSAIIGGRARHRTSFGIRRRGAPISGRARSRAHPVCGGTGDEVLSSTPCVRQTRRDGTDKRVCWERWGVSLASIIQKEVPEDAGTPAEGRDHHPQGAGVGGPGGSP